MSLKIHNKNMRIKKREILHKNRETKSTLRVESIVFKKTAGKIYNTNTHKHFTV